MFITFKRFILNRWLDLLPSSCFGYRRFILKMMNVKISKNAKVNSGFRIYGPGKIEIKDNAWIGQNVHIYTGGFVNVTICENVQVGPETIFNCLTHQVGSKDDRAGECIHHDLTVGKGTWIGCRSTILCSKIGSGCVIGAGSVVLEDVPENKLAAGNPAAVKKSYRK
ncbi:acyltransferase [Treponema sp.]|uniref:acyltransferase n=1 Tax=Treponema sp. TaxID=166 RepID=UPI001D84C296|nr:acyltransferase [Treponema sp.]MBS7310419.1 acyltransferase [Treponema sp.]MDY5886147.1 acyltransferase [Treponema sp.]